MRFKALVVAFALLAGATSPVVSADLEVSPLIPPAGSTDPAAAIDHLRREAVLLLIRETFALLDGADVMQELASVNARRSKGRGPTEAERIALDRSLLAEGSYYLVSLRYLILAGGAAWPSDRPARHYEDDALVRLDALQEQLFEAVASRGDPLPVFVEAQRIWALTEGYKEVPEQRDVFGHRDAIVQDVLAVKADESRT